MPVEATDPLNVAYFAHALAIVTLAIAMIEQHIIASLRQTPHVGSAYSGCTAALKPRVGAKRPLSS